MSDENVNNLVTTEGSAYDKVNDSDSPQETHSIAKFLDVLCEGPIYGFPTADVASHIYLDGTSLQNSRDTANIDHTNFEFRKGTGTQSAMSGDMQVLGTELQYGGAANQIKQGTSASQDVLIRDPNGGLRVEAVKITLNFPSGIYARDPKDGSIDPIPVTIAVDLYPNPVDNPTEKIRRVEHTITGGRTGGFEADIIIEIPGHWLHRTTGENFCEDTIKFEVTKTSTWNESVDYVFMDCHWVRYSKLTRGAYRYPYTAYIGMAVDSRYFSKVPERSYDLKLKTVKIPSNYKPATREYTGIWDGTWYSTDQWTDNPAWCYYDLLTNPRYGLGDYLKETDIDKWALYKIAKYCDELVYTGIGNINDSANWEPRYTCNILLRDRTEAFNVVTTMASIFRGMAYWNGSTLTAIQEAPGPVVAHYNNSNVIDGNFLYQGSSLKARHTAVLVKYLEPDSGYEQRVEYVEDREGIAHLGYREKEVEAAGCTSRSQAHRVGRWILLSEKEETEIVSFSTGLQGITAPPGSIISINDVAKSQDRIAGRVVSATASSLTFDAPVYINPNLNWVLAVVTDIRQQEQLPDGTWEEQLRGQLHTYAINEYSSSLSDTYSVVTLAGGSTFIEQPAEGAVWFLYSATNANNRLYKVLSIAEQENSTYQISALEHYADKYDIVEEYLDLEVDKPPLILNVPALVENIEVEENLIKTIFGEIITQLNITWDAQGYVTSDYFKIGIKKQYQNLYETIADKAHTTSVLHEGAEPGWYQVQVQSFNAFGIGGAKITSPLFEVLGKTAPPGNVDNFLIHREGDEIVLTWDPVTDVDLSHYIIKSGEVWDTGHVITDNIRATSYRLKTTLETATYYLIKAVDTTGNESEDPRAASLLIEAPDRVLGFSVVQFRDRIDFTWRPVIDDNLIGYEIRETNNPANPTWVNSNFIANVDVTKYTLPYGGLGQKSFGIKAIASPGLYSDTASFASTTVAAPFDLNIVFEQDEASASEPDGPPGIFGGRTKDAVVDTNTLETITSNLLGEYYFPVDLSETFRAQNYLDSAFSVVEGGGNPQDTWQNANFTWESPEAYRPWGATLPAGAATVYHDIAPWAGALLTDEIDAIMLDSTSTSYNGIGAQELQNINYDTNGRHYNGAVVVDKSKLSYSIGATASEIPEEFSFSFWVRKENWHTVSCRLIQLQSTSQNRTLEVVYLESTHLFKLLEWDTSGISDVLYSSMDVFLDLPTTSRDVCIGISQTSAGVRGLYVSNINGDYFNSSTETLPAVSGGYNIIKVA